MTINDTIYFYFLLIPVTILLLINLRKMYLMRKHDIVLYGFCQLRRDIIRLIYDSDKEFDEKESKLLKLMLEAVSHSIHNFSDLKKSFRIQFQVPKLTKQEVEKMESFFDITENKEMRLIQIDFIMALLWAGFAYTPFFVPKLSRHLILVISRRVLKIIMKSLEGLSYSNKKLLVSTVWLIDAYKTKYPQYVKERNELSPMIPLRN